MVASEHIESRDVLLLTRPMEVRKLRLSLLLEISALGLSRDVHLSLAVGHNSRPLVRLAIQEIAVDPYASTALHVWEIKRRGLAFWKQNS